MIYTGTLNFICILWIKKNQEEKKMKKSWKLSKVLAILLAVILLFELFPTGLARNLKTVSAATNLNNPRIVADSSMEAGQKVTWDCVWFGSYPQSEVTSGSIYTTLKNAKGWDKNNDIVINGNKYRRLKGEDATYCEASPPFYYDWNKDYSTYHYFKYEPIKWRVLNRNGNNAFLLADVALDDQPYNTNYTDITWKTSSIRSWLNGYGASVNQPRTDYSRKNFIDTAFTASQKNAIYTTNVVNNNNINFGTAGGVNTSDKIFLLSESEVDNTSTAAKYGFVKGYVDSDVIRRNYCSTYAYAMGLYRDKRRVNWWLRSPGEESKSAALVEESGWVNSAGAFVGCDSYAGVRPALHLNLASSDQYSYAGTVCSDKMKKPSNPIASLAGVLRSVKSPAKSTLSIKWKKLNKVTGYQVQVSLKSNFKKGTRQRSFKQKVTSTKVKHLKKKKRYYVRIRPYMKKGSKKYYGKWSTVKSAKIK